MLMIVGVGMTDNTKNEAAAQQLINYLLTESSQSYFAQEVIEYTTRPGVATAEGVPRVNDVDFVEIDQNDLAD